MPFNPVYRSVHNEGCDIHYWYQGDGPLLVMVPGGGGLGKTYNPIFEYLCHKYTICTLDRRQSGQSRVQAQRSLNPSQQVRDIIAVMKDMGFSKTNLFGNSGGGIISLQFAVTHPEFLDRVVSHEAPTSLLLSDGEEIQNRLYDIHSKSEHEGPPAAFKDFRAMQKGFESFPSRVTGGKDDVDNFLRNEFIAFALFCPDLRRLVDNGVKVAVGAGARSEDAWYARTTLAQQAILQCPHHIFPGNHAGFELEPKVFAEKLLEVLDKMQEM